MKIKNKNIIELVVGYLESSECLLTILVTLSKQSRKEGSFHCISETGVSSVYRRGSNVFQKTIHPMCWTLMCSTMRVSDSDWEYKVVQSTKQESFCVTLLCTVRVCESVSQGLVRVHCLLSMVVLWSGWYNFGDLGPLSLKLDRGERGHEKGQKKTKKSIFFSIFCGELTTFITLTHIHNSFRYLSRYRFIINKDSEISGEGNSGIQSQESQDLIVVTSGTSLITQKSSETHCVNVTNVDMVNRYLKVFHHVSHFMTHNTTWSLTYMSV